MGLCPSPWARKAPEALRCPPLQRLLHLPLVQGPFAQDGSRIELDRALSLGCGRGWGRSCDGGGGGRAASAPCPSTVHTRPLPGRCPRPERAGMSSVGQAGLEGGRVGRGPRVPTHRVEGQFLGARMRRGPKPWLLLRVLQESGLGTCAHGCPQMHPGERGPPLCPACCPVQGPWAGPCGLLGG